MVYLKRGYEELQTILELVLKNSTGEYWLGFKIGDQEKKGDSHVFVYSRDPLLNCFILAMS